MVSAALTRQRRRRFIADDNVSRMSIMVGFLRLYRVLSSTTKKSIIDFNFNFQLHNARLLKSVYRSIAISNLLQTKLLGMGLKF